MRSGHRLWVLAKPRGPYWAAVQGVSNPVVPGVPIGRLRRGMRRARPGRVLVAELPPGADAADSRAVAAALVEVDRKGLAVAAHGVRLYRV